MRHISGRIVGRLYHGKTNVVLMVVAKWLHEYDSENRFDGDHDFILLYDEPVVAQGY